MTTMSAQNTETCLDENGELDKEVFARLTDEMLAAFKRGDTDEGIRIGKIIPLHPIMAMAVKNVYGKEYLLSMDLNLTRANMKWGEGWLDEPYRG